MASSQNLYMFAIVPPPELASEINEQRKAFAAKYGFVAALKPPVHITLYEPFKQAESTESEFLKMKEWAGKQSVIKVELKNFDFFKNPERPVIYIDVVRNEALNNFRQSFLVQLRKYMAFENGGNAFNPHFTIGYRDVPPAQFPEIMSDYEQRSFAAMFDVTGFCLWKHNGEHWQTHTEFRLGDSVPGIEPVVQPSVF